MNHEYQSVSLKPEALALAQSSRTGLWRWGRQILAEQTVASGLLHFSESAAGAAHRVGTTDVGCSKAIQAPHKLNESIGLAVEVTHGSCTDLPPPRK